MGRSITEGLYLSPLTRNGSRERVSESDLKNMDDVDTLYSIRGEAPEGWYNAGTKKHASKGSGYEDHQIFKKLPTPEAPAAPKEKKKEKKESYQQGELDIPLAKNNKKIRNFFKEKNTYPV